MNEPNVSTWPAPFEPCDVEQPTTEHQRVTGESREELRVIEIVPAPRLGVPRPIGPGRRERAYLDRVASLRDRVASLGDHLASLGDRVAELETDLARSETSCADAVLAEQKALRELELASLLERGAERRLDRVEAEIARERAELERARQRENRLILALGALQNENQRLAQTLQQLQSPERRALAERASARTPRNVPRASGGWRAFLRRVLGR